MKILIIEDEINIAEPIQKVLKKLGYICEFELDGQKGLGLALNNSYDCIILDLNLPTIDGIEIAREIRKNQIQTPILMLTARSQIYNKLEGFENGADDYLTKPFDFKELIARISALIRRSGINTSLILNAGEIILSPDQNRINIEKTDFEVFLSNKETALFEYLIRNKGRIVSSEELLEKVWDANINFFTDTVKTHIKTLRKKLGEKNKDLIRTVKGKGYMVMDN